MKAAKIKPPRGVCAMPERDCLSARLQSRRAAISLLKMDYELERKYFLEKISDYCRALEQPAVSIHIAEDSRVLFSVGGRPFDALAWVDENNDLVCVTTRTGEMPEANFEEAVEIFQGTLQICWDHCVAVSSAEKRYELSMAVFIGGLTFDAFEGVIFNLTACAEEIEKSFKKKKPKKIL